MRSDFQSSADLSLAIYWQFAGSTDLVLLCVVAFYSITVNIDVKNDMYYDMYNIRLLTSFVSSRHWHAAGTPCSSSEMVYRNVSYC